MRLIARLSFVVFTLLLAAARPARANADDAPIAQRLQAIVKREHLGQFWGAVLVAQDGRPIIASGYGYANDTLAPIDEHTLFDIGSISKQFTAALALRLQLDGKLSIDKPITEYLPGLPAAAKGVTLRHLLNHTSGLSDRAGAIQNLDFADRDEAVRLAFRSPPRAAPGERFEYCNGGYCIAAAIIERVMGGPFQSLVREELFVPAGLANTGFLDGVGLDLSNASARIVSTPGGDSRRSILEDGWGWGLRGCGGVLTSLDDLLRWDAALRGDSIFDDAARSELYSPVLEGYALGWQVGHAANGDLKVAHGGGTRGYRAQLVRIPARGIVIAVLTNDRHNPAALADKLLAELLPEERTGIEASLHIEGLELNEYKAAVIDRDVRINVSPAIDEPDGAPTRLEITVAVPTGNGRADAVRMAMMPGQATKTAAEIHAALAAKPAGQRTAEGIEATIATLRYAPENGMIRLPREVKLVVMPRYTGRGIDGAPIVDERVCLVLMDEANGFWPVILKLDRASAHELADALAPAQGR